MIYDNRDKITGYQKKFNELLEKKVAQWNITILLETL